VTQWPQIFLDELLERASDVLRGRGAGCRGNAGCFSRERTEFIEVRGTRLDYLPLCDFPQQQAALILIALASGVNDSHERDEPGSEQRRDESSQDDWFHGQLRSTDEALESELRDHSFARTNYQPKADAQPQWK